MSSEVCFDVPAEQECELFTQLRPSRGANGPAARVVERVPWRPHVEDVRDEALV
jgi:hypothetical protein